MRVVDASVVVKLVADEPMSDRALLVLERNPQLLVPAHCFAEVGEVLARKVSLGQLSMSQLETALPPLRKALTDVPLHELLSAAIELGVETGASVYDSLYVALAARERCPLVTADRRLIAKFAGTLHAALLEPLDSVRGST